MLLSCVLPYFCVKLYIYHCTACQYAVVVEVMFRDFPAHENLRETFGLESSSEYIVKQQLGLGVPKPRQQLTETTNAISTFATSARFITCIFMAAMLLTDI